ncbi:MAG: ABC transporter permease [Anaerolineales bacterium]
MATLEPEDQSLRNDRPRMRPRWRYAWTIPVTLVLALALWEGLTRWSDLPPFILPPPEMVWRRFLDSLASGSLLRHTGVTLLEVLVGLAIGMTAATCLGYVLAKSRVVERLLAPYIVASQAVPVVAIAPLLVIWFGPGRLSKILISALIVFFPVLVNTIVGVRSVPEELRDLMRSMRATRWQTFAKLEAPAALPVLFGGLKVGATLSVIGAVVGEFVAADEGLGFVINAAEGQYDTSQKFVVVFVLMTIALGLYGLVAGLERSLLAWRRQSNGS